MNRDHLSGAHALAFLTNLESQEDIRPPVVAKPATVQPLPDVLPAEAVFAFAAWLTCRRDPVTLGATHEAGTAAELAAAFCVSQGFGLCRENYHLRVKPYPADPPATEPVIDFKAVAECSDVAKADAGGWIEWGGGSESPVADGLRIDVRLRSGHSIGDCPSDGWDWWRRNVAPDCDIVAYRVVPA